MGVHANMCVSRTASAMCISVQFCTWVLGLQGGLQVTSTALAIASRGMTGLVSFSERSHRYSSEDGLQWVDWRQEDQLGGT